VSYGGLLSLAMAVAISFVGGAMLFDEQREFEAALVALQDEQIALATAIAADFEGRLKRFDEAELERSPAALARAVPRLLGGASELQQARSRIILVSAPGYARFLSADGRSLPAPEVGKLLAARGDRAMLPRESGPALGLPERFIAVGLRRVVTTPGKTWGIAVLASAERLRTRERHAQLRFLLGLVLVTLVVGGFGGLALRDQRRRLAIAREMEVAALQRERERLLAKADKMATLAALSSGVAHQIATPLGTITARVEQLLPVVAGDARATSALRIVHEQVQRIQHTIRGLLDLARSHQPSLLQTQPERVARAALNSVLHRFDRGGVGLALRIEGELPAISCDPPILEQAIVNLLLNALEASEADTQVALHAEALEGRLLISVEDEGHGITEEAMERAGEPFYTTKKKQKGTGLGLAIAQEIVANHGGKLTIARRNDRTGTRATLELPLA
jgi:signal transduction histidine kinase